MAYAERTTVSVDQTRAEIERTLKRYGATAFAYASEAGRAAVMFEAHQRRIRFDLPLPPLKDSMTAASLKTGEQVHRQRWRALLLAIKSKLESVASGIESFEIAFLGHVVLPDGSTVGQHAAKSIALAYERNTMVPLLPHLDGRASP
ncbi:hypothetical protein ACVMII_000795 [Bradyrhizobium diazoefficiens]